MTDAEWEAQNSGIGPDEARAKGLCWMCGGVRKLYSAFGGERIAARCPECKGGGKAEVPIN